MSERLVAKRRRRHQRQRVQVEAGPHKSDFFNLPPACFGCCPLRGDDDGNYATTTGNYYYQNIYVAKQELESSSTTRNSSDHRLAEWPPEVARGHSAGSSCDVMKEDVMPSSRGLKAVISSRRRRRRSIIFPYCSVLPGGGENVHKLCGCQSTTRILPLLLLMCLLCLLLQQQLGTIKTISAYQLTNNLIANNLPPKFVQTASGGGGSSSTSTGSGQSTSEIVLRVKEGPQSIGKLIYTLRGEDPDDDPLTFGVLGAMASDLLRIENVPGNQANVYLRKELDRETTESHQVVITLTDGKLGKGNWVSFVLFFIEEELKST